MFRLLSIALLACLLALPAAASEQSHEPMHLDAVQMDGVNAGLIRLPRVPSLRDTGFSVPRLPRVPSVGRVPSVDSIFDLRALLGRAVR